MHSRRVYSKQLCLTNIGDTSTLNVLAERVYWKRLYSYLTNTAFTKIPPTETTLSLLLTFLGDTNVYSSYTAKLKALCLFFNLNTNDYKNKNALLKELATIVFSKNHFVFNEEGELLFVFDDDDPPDYTFDLVEGSLTVTTVTTEADAFSIVGNSVIFMEV